MTPTIILFVVIAQFVLGGIGLVVWRKSATKKQQPDRVTINPEVTADSDKCQALLGNIGQLLTSHGQLLRYLDRGNESKTAASADSIAGAFASRKIHFGKMLEGRVDELSEVLERYDDLYLHERLQIKDYASQAEQLELLLSSLEATAGEDGTTLARLVRGMLEENRRLRTTVDGCRTRITELVAIAMKSGRDARLDALTQLPNRRAWVERLSVLNDTQRMGVAVLDIDNFKSFNDKYGHAGGDAILRLVSRILREETRVLPFRNGGDEFYLLIECRAVDEAKQCVESIRNRVERASVLFDGKRLSATITGGVAFPIGEEVLSSVVVRADQALYVAKETKNVICVDLKESSTSV